MEPFEIALNELDFETAEALVAEMPEDARADARARLDATREQVARQARALAHEIQQLARDNEFQRLIEIRENPQTPRLLALLSPEIERGSHVQLEGAQKWLEQRVAASRRHLRRARDAIAGYDTARARIELSKIRVEHLTDEERAELEDLAQQLEAVEMERIEIEVATRDVLTEHQAEAASARRRTMIVWGLVIAVVVIVAVFVGR